MRSFFHECISLIRVLVRACTSQKRVLKTRENPSENKKLFSLTHGACAIFVIIARMKKNYFPLINAPVLYGLELKTSEKKVCLPVCPPACLSVRLWILSVDTIIFYIMLFQIYFLIGEKQRNWRDV